MVTLTIVIGTAICSILAFNNPALFEKYLFSAYAIKNQKQNYRFLSHAFIHVDWVHLIMNLYVLYTFGKILETGLFPQLFGKLSTLYFILLYTGAIYASSIADYIQHKNNPTYSAVGASGAVSAIVFSFILIIPKGGLGLMFLPFNIPAWIFGLLYLAYSWYMNKKNIDNVGHGAHFWGAVFGLLFTGILKPALFANFFLSIVSPSTQ